MVQIVLNVLQKFRKFLYWLWKQEGTPSQISRGIAVGVFSGCFPFFGLQTILGIMLASLFRGNRLLAVSATWISNPFTYLPLYWFNFKLGLYILGGDKNSHELSHFSRQELWDQSLFFSIRMLLGSCIVGIFFGLISGSVVYFFIKIFANKKRVY
tara:strand:+ start:42470 stop:42934 length:465 start_codon:yes stop_codon:yes gene_type:complete